MENIYYIVSMTHKSYNLIIIIDGELLLDFIYALSEIKFQGYCV